MNKPITQDEINRLKAPFPLEAHSIREGTKAGNGRIQWFVYLEKTEVETRLNEVFPGEWGSSQPVLTPLGNSVAATISITIRGITRGNTGEDSNGQEKAKGATTDAFRRTAADWGVAKYLWEMEEIIYTDGYEKGEWDKQKQRKNEAFGKFKQWYQKKFAGYKPSNISNLPSESRQDAPSSDLQQQTASVVVDTPTAAETAKAKLGTPSKQTVAPKSVDNRATGYNIGDLKTRALKEIYENNVFHMNKSLDKLNAAGLLPTTLTLEQALEVIRTRKEVDVAS
jgi:hypothetical protein